MTEDEHEYLVWRLLRDASRRCEKSGVQFALEQKDIRIPSRCPALGIPIERNRGASGPSQHSPSLDRIDPLKGYTPDNVRVISYRANTIKHNASLDELQKIVNYVERSLDEQARAGIPEHEGAGNPAG